MPERGHLATIAPMPRPLRLFLASAALLAAPSSASADVSPLLYGKTFDVAVSAKSVTRYEIPRTYGASDCFHENWHEASASETWTFRSKGTTRLGAVGGADAIGFIRVKGNLVESGVVASGTIDRTSSATRGADPGDCGGGEAPTTRTGSDCGHRDVRYDVALEIVMGRLSIKPLTATGADPNQGSFSDCVLPTARGASDGGWAAVEQRIRMRSLAESKKTVTVKASRTFRNDVVGTLGWTETTTSWTVTFKPVRKRLPKAGRR